MERNGFQKDYEASNHFEIGHAGKFFHARVGTGRAGLSMRCLRKSGNDE